MATSAMPPPSPPPQMPTLSSATTAAPAGPPLTAASVNSFRLVIVMNRLLDLLERGVHGEQLVHLCSSLSRGMDFALAINDVPQIVDHLPPLVERLYRQRNDTSVDVQAAITVLMVSVKNAVKNGWFHAANSNELLNMANELCNSCCMTVTVTAEVNNVLDTIARIIPRFYPWLKLCRLIASFEAKTGYDCLMADFDIQRTLPPEEKILLFVARTDNLETSSCLISPPNVSFLVNGRGVERRTNVSLDNGPQFPTNITKMLKCGINFIQAVGYFAGNYIIAITTMCKIVPSTPVLDNYVPPVVAALAPDSDLIERASKISLNCPLSFRRIRTPVKGHLCKHHQCFDYDNFMEMNLRKPSWCCPCCNQPVSCIDLRIDQKMVKILSEVGDNADDIIITSDGLWRIAEQNDNTAQVQIGNMEFASNRSSNALPNLVDLTMEKDGEIDAPLSSRQLENVDGLSDWMNYDTCETEDRKPFRGLHSISELSPELLLNNCAPVVAQGASSQILDETWSSTSASNDSSISTAPIDAHRAGTLESLIPNFVPNADVRGVVFPEHGREHTSLEASQSTLSLQSISQVGQLAEDTPCQHPCIRNSLHSNETGRPPIPRNVNRAPIAVQALPVRAQASNLSQMTCTNAPGSSSSILDSSPSISYQTFPSITAVQDGFGTGGGHTEIRQASRTSGIVSPPLPLHAITQNHDQDRQYNLNAALQQVVGLQAPADQQRGARAYRSGLHPSSENRNPHHQMLNLQTHQTISQCTSTLPRSRAPSRQSQQELQVAAGMSVESLVNQHNQSLAAQYATQVVGLQPIVHPYAASRTRSSFPTTDDFRLAGYNQLQDMVGALPIFDGISLPELPSEQSWYPTGRMRGSLSGGAYSAALSHYLAQPMRQVTARPPISLNIASTSDPRSVLIGNINNAPGSLI